MLRGSSHRLQRSARFLTPVVELLVASGPGFWEIDAICYDGPTIQRLLDTRSMIGGVIGSTSDTLVTKVMLGVFGCVPAFDSNFKLGFEVSTFCAKSLSKVSTRTMLGSPTLAGCPPWTSSLDSRRSACTRGRRSSTWPSSCTARPEGGARMAMTDRGPSSSLGPVDEIVGLVAERNFDFYEANDGKITRV